MQMSSVASYNASNKSPNEAPVQLPPQLGGSAYTKASHKGNRYEAVHQMDTCYINDGDRNDGYKTG
jgi:hypothetical protein